MEVLIKKATDFKLRYPGFIILMLVGKNGNTAQAYNHDARIMANILELPLLNYNGNDYCEFDYKNLDKYLPKLVRSGEKVAICEQTQEP